MRSVKRCLSNYDNDTTLQAPIEWIFLYDYDSNIPFYNKKLLGKNVYFFAIIDIVRQYRL
ncbi:hypothetical protein KSC_057650 [Ktedonobacter sp. SOSP1-52]|nr:hypothetical protein KSC_057650 [Ktedonobacter sp. SOSP1-52]